MKQRPLKRPWVGEKHPPCSPSTTGGDTSTTTRCAPELEPSPTDPHTEELGLPQPWCQGAHGDTSPLVHLGPALSTPRTMLYPPGPPHAHRERIRRSSTACHGCDHVSPLCHSVPSAVLESPNLLVCYSPLSCSLPSQLPVFPYPTSLLPLVPIFPVSINFHPHPQISCPCTLIFPCAWLNCVLPKMILQPLQGHFSALIYPNCENFFPSIYLEFPFLQLVLVISHPLLCT